MPLRIKQRNPGAIKKLLQRYDKGIDIAVGLPKGSEVAGVKYPDGTDLLDVAMWNEFGTSSIPERSFIRVGVRANLDDLNKLAANLVKELNEGKIDIETAGEALGLKAADGVKSYIVELTSPPNAPATIKIKKSSNPLVDTGLLNQSITHEVRER